jgi:hypothetical protein
VWIEMKGGNIPAEMPGVKIFKGWNIKKFEE